ncbi:MAG: DUF4198 domain-containing protein [Marinovum algicola]|jgi:hypothetical protein|uniref:Uncharacterized conserved protein, contains GH25 family domain n=1 Tax=Marinovum algicola TaxID=42444 RepID=A0A975W8V9_9RHOB|nr:MULTISPECIES: DUF4198 domain-containing protein [Marinovum]MDD9739758.1 DUF4198 domain-containing protein [Marinovum sp. SP66]MDD9744582.1 DUF4198 domain-containing protein [Marinovum sp. PR37]SEJ21106.1 Uncharacterized conserved protein, contains GH25 family domain [Marinovum algicola]SLN75664.1 Nickel uptake substrate-specific transmembrane region [Marinovum algicola]
MIRRLTATLGLGLGLSAFPLLAAAHEFYIDALAWQVPSNSFLMANIRVGEKFEGPAYSYFPPRIRRFDILMNDQTYQIRGRAGDRPALRVPTPDDGLAVVVHVTNDTVLTYQDYELFESFLIHKDWAPLLEEHKARGLSETGVRERYSRYGKALIAVGDGAGADREAGLETEIVALANPYTDDLSDGLPVRVLYQGAPRADAQVELFAKSPEGEVEITLLRTDAEGVALLPVTPGQVYLADAVVVRPLEPVAEDDPVWESLWASLTFKVPE